MSKKGRGKKKETSAYNFLTEVLDDDWQVVHASPDDMRKDVDSHNRYFGAIDWLWVQIRPHPKGCEVKKARPK